MIAAMTDLETYSGPQRRPLFRTALKFAVSLVALAISLASLFAAGCVGLVLLGY
jgi:hypothetical protein